jgi:lipoprotein signal peptidase
MLTSSTPTSVGPAWLGRSERQQVNSIHHPSWRRAVAVAFGCLALDQVTKAAATSPTADGWVLVSPTVNADLALGVGGPPLSIAAVLGLMAAAGAVAVALMLMRQGRLAAWPAGLVAGGAASNAVDRVLQSGVVDWLELPFLYMNLADVAIAAGLVAITVAFKNCVCDPKEVNKC